MQGLNNSAVSKVLVIDDNPAIGAALRLQLELEDIEVQLAFTPQAGLQQLATEVFDLVIQDMNFSEATTSGAEGKDLFRAIRAQAPDMPVILITAWTAVETAVELVRAGAADYIAKPWDDNKLLACIHNLLELSELQRRQREYFTSSCKAINKLRTTADLRELIFQSQAMQELVSMAIKVAPSEVPVLITGNNGCGKEKIAEIIQANSRVANGPFVRVNVGALPEDLMEAELFGAEAGAYTGISKKRLGRFELADGGTLFLDELGNLSPNGQAKLLRVLQTGQFERLGSSETLGCRVRVISATNSDLTQRIIEGKFREDLYYRLNVIELQVPALAERPEDILPLAAYFLGTPPSINITRLLQSHHWPGNVRELENVCRRAQLLSSGRELQWTDFGISLKEGTHKHKPLFVEPSEALIREALQKNQGNISLCARQLGLTRQALYRRLQKYQIDL